MPEVISEKTVSWLGRLVQFAVTVIVTLALAYARFVGVETMARDNRTLILETRATALTLSERVNTLEVTERINENAIRESLNRVEATLKDIRVDVRELQQKSKP